MNHISYFWYFLFIGDIPNTAQPSVTVNEENASTAPSTVYDKKAIELMIAQGKFAFREKKTICRKGSERLVQSPIWKTFHLVYNIETNADIPTWYVCTSCNEPVQNIYKDGTTTKFHRHLKVRLIFCSLYCFEMMRNKISFNVFLLCYLQVCQGSGKQSKVSDFFVTKSRPETVVSDDHKSKMGEAAVRFVSEDLRPYSAIEGNGCFQLMSASFELGQAYPNMSIDELQASIPNRRVVHALVENKSNEAKAMISKKLHEAINVSGGFAATVDLWTDKFRQKSYLGITAHTNTLTSTEIVADRFVIGLLEVEEDSKTKEVWSVILWPRLMILVLMKRKFESVYNL